MRGEISFDTQLSDLDNDHIEGCYRLSDDAWTVFHLTHITSGALWTGPAKIREGAIFSSGIRGIDGVFPIYTTLNKKAAMDILSKTLGGVDWIEVSGPDSLTLK